MSTPTPEASFWTYNNRNPKSYNGELMKKGHAGEETVLSWLKQNCRNVIDVREFRLSQRLDVDFGIETIDGKIVLAEVKTDYNLGNTDNFLFEIFRINHFIKPDKIFYLGWTFRSPAKYLLYYSPSEHSIYKFHFDDVRSIIGQYVSKTRPQIIVTPTDEQKTTFNFLIPQSAFDGYVKVYKLSTTPRLTNMGLAKGL